MKIAVFTIVKNENIFLPLWMKHYRRYFDDSDIYILDNDSDDNSTNDITYKNVKIISSDSCFNADWLRKQVQAFQHELLERYEYVLFSEVDEFIFPIDYNSIADYIRVTGNKKAYRCAGYEVVHMYDKEDDIDLNRNLLCQRRVWYKSKMYSKTLLTRTPLFYGIGFHNCSVDLDIRDDFLLLHLHKIDLKLSMLRNKHRLNRPVDANTIKHKQGWQNYTDDMLELKKYFIKKYCPLTDFEEIPESIKYIV